MSALLPWLLVAIAVAVAGFLVRGIFLGYPDKILPGAMLTGKEQAIVAACADAFFPPGGPIPVSGTEAGLVAYLDGYLSRLPQANLVLTRLLLQAVEHGPWLFGPRLCRFTRLRPAERIASLKDMAESSIYLRRICFTSMRAMLTMGYLANGEVARRMGMVCNPAPFDGRPSQEAFA